MEIDDDVLTRAGIREAEAVAAVARDESTNIMAAEVAKNVFHVPRVVVRIDEPELAELYRKQGYEVISPIVEATQTLNRTLRPKEAS
jgi:trk system potassium uptake protein TrkA